MNIAKIESILKYIFSYNSDFQSLGSYGYKSCTKIEQDEIKRRAKVWIKRRCDERIKKGTKLI